MTREPEPQPVLQRDVVYNAWDRYVCGDVHCAGMTAAYSGVTIGGFPLSAVTREDVIEWKSAGLGQLTCECGRLTAQAGPLTKGGGVVFREI